MSTEVLPDFDAAHGISELTVLGKRLEILRIERGVSKQRLARHAGTSRQQLWRVMTGKSALTGVLRDRLAAALAVEPGSINPDARLVDAGASGAAAKGSRLGFPVTLPAGVPTVTDYLVDARHVAD